MCRPGRWRLQEYAGDYDLGEDEEIESFYFSSAAGRARVVLGNRRYGEGAPLLPVGSGWLLAGWRTGCWAAARAACCCAAPAAGPSRGERAARCLYAASTLSNLDLCAAGPRACAGGFISGGRRQARPVVERKRSNKMGKAGEHAVVGTPPVPPAPANFRTPNAGGGRKARPGSAGTSSSTPGACPPAAAVSIATTAPGSCRRVVGSAVHPGLPAKQRRPALELVFICSLPACLPAVPFPTGAADFYGSSPGASGGAAIYGSSPSGSGRRARRNARRAAMDAGLEAAEGSWGSRG